MLVFNAIVEYIINDISSVLRINDLYNPLISNKEQIKKEINIKYGKFHFGKSFLKPGITEILYSKAQEDRLKYAYYVLEAFALLDEYTFNYKIIDYCEQRTTKPNTEQNYMHYCLNNIVYDKSNSISKTHLCYLYRELIKQIYPDDSTVSLDRMISYVKTANESCLPFCSADTINEICDLYIEELRNHWELYAK